MTYELLAPAGNREMAIAAIHNGVNALYLSGQSFGARAYAANFSQDALEEIIKYAHLRDVRIYVTVNTLIKESELDEAMVFVAKLVECGVDALILQDLGLADLIRKTYPDLPLHGSTQMTVHNYYGAKILSDLGFSRVILARETALDDIKRIDRDLDIELEHFIHGSLCISYSGACLMSSMIGGRSGNRGRCAQPCRKAYTIEREDGTILDDAMVDAPLISPKDLAVKEEITTLKKAGVSSFKIEGRMKKPEYVATTVSIYRQLLEGNQPSTETLLDSSNRGFTKGFTLKDFGQGILVDPKAQKGTVVGEVEAGGVIRWTKEVYEDDGLQLETEKGKILPHTMVRHHKKGDRIRFQEFPDLGKGTAVRRVHSQKLNQNYETSIQKEYRLEPLTLRFEGRLGELPKLIAISGSRKVTVFGDKPIEVAQKRGIHKDKVAEQLSKLGDTIYVLGDIVIELEDNLFLALSELNQLRRKAVEGLNDLKTRPISRHATRIDEKTKSPYSATLPILPAFDTYNGTMKDETSASRVYIHGISQLEGGLPGDEREVYFVLPRIMTAQEAEDVMTTVESVADRLTGLVLTDIGHFELARKYPHLKCHTDYGMNVYNHHTVEVLRGLGATSVTCSVELTLDQIKALAKKASLPLEAMAYGRTVVMTMAFCPMSPYKGCVDSSGCETCGFSKRFYLKDEKQMRFPFERRNKITEMHNSVPIDTSSFFDELLASGIQIYRVTDAGEGDMKEAVAFLNHPRRTTSPEEKGFTKGHYFKEVE